MGITSALYSGVSGLNTNSQAMSVIGNNLANTNTVAYKSSRTIFSDLLSSTIIGSGGTSQVGRGVNVSVVDSLFSQGTFESTESGLDLAIEGDGFFILKEPDNDVTYYSRAGSFRFDEDGFLVNPEGYRVQGKAYENGELVAGDPGDIQVEDAGLTAAQQTAEVTFNTNLNSGADALGVDFDYTDADTYNYSSSVTVYDSLGESHLVTVYFVKDDAADNTWNWFWTAEDADGNIMGSDIDGTDGVNNNAGTMTFDEDGNLLTGGGPNAIGAIDWGNGSDAAQDIEFNFDTTQYDSDSEVISVEQDGYAAGNLTSIDINDEGAVVASYSNGEQVLIANLVLGRFTNPNGLELVGSNLYTATATSGEPRVGLPGPELGKIFTNSLEQSTVDMGKEFVTMITVQRGFQANSKIITTVDELLGELIDLKR